ncbi:hypothetical protein A1F94_001018 [Pyrenophora tritici-repentis]|nr:hypothetical protein A1F99_016330 [Pyrenophora tritici-repentis]KAG9388126.1 hypothetical protein A1F94_001018 [Pyrenophora tritici-repentis]KAI0617733.1 hypothetical protein TUN199_10281 [Pyrenophora tritici-repentis]KAI1528948.1 hypothetical protein PtrSN001C_009259 [Pyrenophora tritici-repentis]KAI1563587.1 hypothetical protein PtrEW4_009323 [Pyrenophora tritici-repentis]
MMTENTTLCGLPDELLVEIMQHLSIIRSDKIQSFHFQKFISRDRESENRARQLALYNLCLAYKHVRRIATPILYSSFTGAADWNGTQPLKLFHRTLNEHNVVAGQHFKHAEYLQYVENRAFDGQDIGDSYADEKDPESAHMLAHYFYLLADIVNQAMNIQNLTVDSLETHKITFWGYILPGYHGITVLARHAFRKLQTLHVGLIERATPGHHHITRPFFFLEIATVMTSVPLLSNLQAYGSLGLDVIHDGVFSGSYQRLQRLEILDYGEDFGIVGQIWSACEELQHIVCLWAPAIFEAEGPSALYPALLQKLDTLETLHLDFCEVHFEDSSIAPECLGTL